MKKNSCTPITLKNIHAMALKKSYREFDNEKKFLRLENSPSPPPPNFSNGPSLLKTLNFPLILLTINSSLTVTFLILSC